VKLYPALDVDSSSELLLAFLDDFSPTALEPRDGSTRVFFSSGDARDAAGNALREAGYSSRPLDVPDEDWARRSQENLGPITVGRITVVTPWHSGALAPWHPELAVVIVPSMGFGTGHHETTRLCLQALQEIDLAGTSVLDVGTGSGVLAIAADRLGASSVLGVDSDPDALQSARENLALNPHATRTAFEQRDVTSAALPRADVVTANLTGALLVRIADRLTETAGSGGRLILSGILKDERDAVRRAFAGLESMWEQEEGEWAGLVLKT
jgi:ribosomal protein L11 methyltransferase